MTDRPGGLVQLDPLTITLQPGVAIKQFTDYCPKARWTVAHASRRATSTEAAVSLDKVLSERPRSRTLDCSRFKKRWRRNASASMSGVAIIRVTRVSADQNWERALGPAVRRCGPSPSRRASR
jgi:hypothetical protein